MLNKYYPSQVHIDMVDGVLEIEADSIAAYDWILGQYREQGYDVVRTSEPEAEFEAGRRHSAIKEGKAPVYLWM